MTDVWSGAEPEGSLGRASGINHKAKQEKAQVQEFLPVFPQDRPESNLTHCETWVSAFTSLSLSFMLWRYLCVPAG